MELREFYEFDSWPPDSGRDRREAVQLVAREVGALVAVRRSVADVDWIQQVQNVIGAANVRSTTQADSAMAIGRGVWSTGRAADRQRWMRGTVLGRLGGCRRFC